MTEKEKVCYSLQIYAVFVFCGFYFKKTAYSNSVIFKWPHHVLKHKQHENMVNRPFFFSVTGFIIGTIIISYIGIFHSHNVEKGIAKIPQFKIIFNGGPIQWGMKRGIPRTAESLLDQLYEFADSYFWSIDQAMGYSPPNSNKGWNKLRKTSLAYDCQHPSTNCDNTKSLGPIDNSYITIYHQPSGMYPEGTNDAFPNVLHKRSDVRLVGTVHDLIPYFIPSWQGDAYLQRFRGLEKLDALVAISHTTARHIMEHLNYPAERIFVAYWGADPQFKPILDTTPVQDEDTPAAKILEFEAAKKIKIEPVVKELNSHEPLKTLKPGFIFCLAAPDPRKNPHSVVKAYAKLPKEVRQKHQLVQGSSYDKPSQQDFLRMARGIDTSFGDDEILYTGHLSDEQLQKVYQSADLNIMASFFEGFGMPLVEAMASDTLSVAAKTTSTGEIVTIPELQFDPANVSDIHRVMAYALNVVDNDIVKARYLRNQQLDAVKTKFTWNNCVNTYLAAYSKAASLPPMRDITAEAPLFVDYKRTNFAVFGNWTAQTEQVTRTIINTFIRSKKLRQYHLRIDMYLDPSVSVHNIVDNLRHDDFLRAYVNFHTRDAFSDRQTRVQYSGVVLLTDSMENNFKNQQKIFTMQGSKSSAGIPVTPKDIGLVIENNM
jgi:glycosyltransferase involved in cell wall biosynthesis